MKTCIALLSPGKCKQKCIVFPKPTLSSLWSQTPRLVLLLCCDFRKRNAGHLFSNHKDFVLETALFFVQEKDIKDIRPELGAGGHMKAGGVRRGWDLGSQTYNQIHFHRS